MFVKQKLTIKGVYPRIRFTEDHLGQLPKAALVLRSLARWLVVN